MGNDQSATFSEIFISAMYQKRDKLRIKQCMFKYVNEGLRED